MKILLSAYACKPNRGSEDGYGWNWAKSLSEIGHEVWVLTWAGGREYIEPEMVREPIPRIHFVYLDDNPSNPIDRLVDATPFHWQYRYFRWQHRALAVVRQLDYEVNFDLIHHVTWGSVTAGSRLWQLEKPFVFGPVGGGQTAPVTLKKYFLDKWKSEALRSLLFRKFARFNWFFRQTVSHASLVFATNIDTYELAARLGAGQKQLELFFDPGLPENWFPPEFPSRQNEPELKLLWVGSLLPRKGIRLTLEALSKVDPSIPYKLTIVGDGMQSSSLPQWIREFGLEKVVDYRGRLPWLEVRELYLASNAFFFTSLRDSCPTQFLEAMAYGLPIVTLDIHGAKKFIPPTAGIKVPVTDADNTVAALANGIEYLYHHPQARIEMGRVGYDFAQTQTWSAKAERATEHYQRLVEAKTI
ncbi:MAG: glycosyltransferase [Cyanobacteria bacterium J06623_7]